VQRGRLRKAHETVLQISAPLVVGFATGRLAAYIAAALFVVSLFDRPPFWLEFLVYVFLGFLWILPFKFVFLGVGKADPEADNQNQ
jgi:hypothetical protein